VPSDGGSAVETTYSDGKVSVVSWSLNGAGHPTPSKKVIKGTRIGEKQNQDIEFAEVAWNFFKSQLNH
jgi:poly(3-hydroxybutyrate) depolymerase